MRLTCLLLAFCAVVLAACSSTATMSHSECSAVAWRTIGYEDGVAGRSGAQIGVHRRQLEAGVAQIHRAIERRRVLHPFEPEPAFDGWHRLQHALLQLVDRAVERGDQVWNHALILGRTNKKGLPEGSPNSLKTLSDYLL